MKRRTLIKSALLATTALAIAQSPVLAADVTLIAPDIEFTIEADRFESLSRNCPFNGWQAKGRAIMTIVSGRVVYEHADGV